MRMKWVIALMLIGASGLLVAAFLLMQLALSQSVDADPIPRAEYNPPHSVSDFTLTNHDGQPMSLSDVRGAALGSEGKPVWLFFGYTHCPNMCPLTMAMMKTAKAQLGDAGKQVAFVFVSVDGRSDTPDVVKRFVQSFDPDFIGLTGEEDRVREIAKEFSAQFDAPTPAPHEPHDMQGEQDAPYMVSHTPYSYLLDKQGRWRFLYVSRTPIETIVQDIQRVLSE